MEEDDKEFTEASSDPTIDEHLPVAGEIPEEDHQISKDDLDV
jgi:hypothetical protein